MSLVLTNPWGLLALLGIPALILIYYLRRQARVVTVSTLFLLQRSERESRAGRRFETFSNSLPFWIQVLAVLLLTWILVQPRYGHHRVTRQIAIVVDSSASMQPLREVLAEKLQPHLDLLQGSADHSSFIVLDHDPRRPRLYQGDDPRALLRSFEGWNPSDGALDPTAALRIARSLVGPDGTVVYLTDHDGPALPLSSHRLALGTAKVNCGFTGVTVEQEGDEFVWSAIVRNYSDVPQTREWTVETADRRRSEVQVVTLPARRFVTLEGRFPVGESRALLRLTGDEFPLDDVMPLVVKQPRVARLFVKGAAVRGLGERMVRGFAHLDDASGPEDADLTLTGLIPEEGSSSENPLIIFPTEGSEPRPTGPLLSEEHPLTTGLNFQSLSLRSVTKVELRPDDQPLLWSGEHPLILLRRDPISRAEQLVFSFSLKESNAARLPSIAVLLHRFCETVARETFSPHTGILETSQLLAEEFPKTAERGDLALSFTALDGEAEEVPLKTGFRVTQRTAPLPGFLSLDYQGERLLDAAVYFADTREADLTQATSTELPDLESGLVELRTREDRWWRWVAFILVLLLLGAWHFLTPNSQAK